MAACYWSSHLRSRGAITRLSQRAGFCPSDLTLLRLRIEEFGVGKGAKFQRCAPHREALLDRGVIFVRGSLARAEQGKSRWILAGALTDLPRPSLQSHDQNLGLRTATFPNTVRTAIARQSFLRKGVKWLWQMCCKRALVR